MNVICVPSGPLQANSYIVYEDKNNAIIIDAGGYSEVKSALQKNGIIAKCVLLTHGHFDHCAGAKEFQNDGYKIYVSEKDVEQIKKGLFASSFNMQYIPVEPDEFLLEGECFICGITINVISTPGHTEGGVSFVINDMIFTGDTLFHRNIGRTDLFGGDSEQIKDSLRKLFELDGEYIVYPGHGESTSLSSEKSFFARWLGLCQK